MNRSAMSTGAVSSTKKRLAIFTMAACVLLSGCGVRMGMEKVDEAEDAKKQAEDVQHKVEKDLKKQGGQ
jgi:protein involved in sex pheromone biosynthesis